MDEVESLLSEQAAYYRAYGGDYDDVYAGRASWDELMECLPIRGDVLELACGTGRWTPLLAANGRSVTAVDISPEMIRVAAKKVEGLPVNFVVADVLTWHPSLRYDTVFFGFWLSHVPPTRFDAFWSSLRGMLKQGGSVCFLDSNPEERDIEEPLVHPVPTVRRKLKDGREYRVVKVFYSAAELSSKITALGWSASVRNVYGRFYLGVARPYIPTPD